MADLTVINLDGVPYSVKDATSRNLGNTMVKYTQQTLAVDQQIQALANIGAGKVGRLSFEYVTTVVVLCNDGTNVTISRTGFSPMSAVSVDGQCVFDLPGGDSALGYWRVTGTRNGVSAYLDVDVEVLGNTYEVDLEEVWPSSTLYVSCPFGAVTLVCSKGSSSYTATTTAGYYEFTLEESGIWTVTMSAADHVDVVKTVNVAVLGGSYDLDMGDWPATRLTVTHPANADITCKNGSTYALSSTSISSTSTRFDDLSKTGTWVVTATDFDGYHLAMSQSINVATIGVDLTLNTIPTTWDTVLVEVIHPSGATCTCTKSGTSITGTTSGSTSRFYVTSTGSWTITVSGTGHADLTDTVSVTNMNANGYTKDFDTVWPPAVLTVTHPANADVTCKSGSTTVFGEYVSSTVTEFPITTANKTWTVKIHDMDAYHNDVSTTVSVPTVGVNHSASLAWTDVLVEISVPTGATVSCVNTSTQASGVFKNKTGDTHYYYVTNGTWKCSASHASHSTMSKNISNVSVASANMYSTNVGDTWSDSLLTINHPSKANEATLTMKSGSSTSSTYFTVVSSTDTQTVYSLKTVGRSYTFTCASTTSIHSTKTIEVTRTEHTTTWSAQTVAWTDVALTVAHPSGATLTCKKSSTTYTGTSVDNTHTKYFVTSGTYNVTAFANGHTLKSGSKKVTAANVTGNSAVTLSLGTSWSDTTIWVAYSEGAKVTLTVGDYVTTVASTGDKYTNDGVIAKLAVPYDDGSSSCYVKSTNGEIYHDATVAYADFGNYTQSSPLDVHHHVPTAYTQRKYLSASGGGYMDIGVIFNANMTITLKFTLSSGAIGGTYCELAQGYGDETVWLAFPAIVSGSCRNFVGSSTGTSAPTSGSNSVSGSSLSGYGYGYLVRALGYSLPTIYLFALNEIYESGNTWVSGRAFNKGTGRIEFLFIEERGNYTHAYVPCTPKGGSTPIMYDIMTDRTYQGTGLTAGPIGSSF